MAKRDYLHLDDDLDFPLESLLGEYTDYDDENDDTSDDDFCVESAKKKKKPPVRGPKATAVAGYRCPVCSKTLKTISGFRGHCDKQHGLRNVKAYDHRTTDATEKTATVH